MTENPIFAVEIYLLNGLRPAKVLTEAPKPVYVAF
jgi:hypothetical protein